MSALGKLRSFHSDLKRGCVFHGVPYPLALARSLRLYSLGQFSRKEIIGYGLFVPSITDTMPVLISKERSLGLLGRINPPDLQHLTENKDEFYAICREQGLPIPETYGWTVDGQRYDAEGNPVEGDRAWGDYLFARLPEDFIVKDRAGAYGSGFDAFHRTGNAFRSAVSGQVHDLGGLLATLSRAGGHDGVVIQERLFDAAPLSTLCGRRGLQTMRINTLLNPDGRVSILFYMIKILAGNTVSDNFSMGTTGNLIAFGDSDCVLRGAVTLHECGSGMTAVTVHPGTGASLDGFELPGALEAMELVKAAQRCFPMLPTLGWDVALTDQGSRIIEANARWDPPLYAPFLMTESDWRTIFGSR
jgi:hypothetical protein